jgi:hypothetical protein
MDPFGQMQCYHAVWPGLLPSVDMYELFTNINCCGQAMEIGDNARSTKNAKVVRIASIYIPFCEQERSNCRSRLLSNRTLPLQYSLVLNVTGMSSER